MHRRSARKAWHAGFLRTALKALRHRLRPVTPRTGHTEYETNKIFITMSETSKRNRERRALRQEEEGKNVVKWIFGILIALAVIFMIYVSAIMS